jgi:hypothetical protein
MALENPLALHFIMQDELYLLNSDKLHYSRAAQTIPAEQATAAGVVFDYPVTGKRDFVILVHYPEHEVMAEAHLTALENILKRRGLNVTDVSIVNTARHPMVDFEKLVDFFNPQKILLMGLNAMPPGIMPLTLNQPLIQEDYTLLYSFSFHEMMDSNDNKKAFWEQMKVL